jgi:hypothetical protein
MEGSVQQKTGLETEKSEDEMMERMSEKIRRCLMLILTRVR